MARYITEKCPECNYKFKVLESYDGFELGNPYKECPNCGTIVKSKNINEWPLMSKTSKFKYYFETVFGGFLFLNLGVGFVIFVNLVLIKNTFNILFIENNFNLIHLILYIVSIPFIIYISFKTTYEDIKNSKERMKNEKYAKLIISRNEFLENKDDEIMYI